MTQFDTVSCLGRLASLGLRYGAVSIVNAVHMCSAKPLPVGREPPCEGRLVTSAASAILSSTPPLLQSLLATSWHIRLLARTLAVCCFGCAIKGQIMCDLQL